MKSYPTKYNGVQFRSRLEAKWAAFFDIIGWQWEYEPVDLDGYVPDFLASPPDQFPFQPLVFEVKPVPLSGDITDVLAKAHKANVWSLSSMYVVIGLGLGGQPRTGDAQLGRATMLIDDRLDTFNFDVRWLGGEFIWTVGEPREPRAPYTDAAVALASYWREAGNRTQWRKPRARW